MSALFALIDCNNFFASCEQVFRPGLAGNPLVVLSRNDGCVVARSAEARALNIPMAAPAFKYKELFKQHNVIQFSANFELYGDISRRITEILTSVTPRLEVYSIDESFLDISQLDIADYTKWAEQLRATIFQWVGMQVSIGIAPTKTLAKLGSSLAKRDATLSGVLYLNSPATTEKYLQRSRVEDIWGIGRKLGPRLRANGIATALDVARLSPTQGRQVLGSVHGERLVRELNNQSCYLLESLHSDQKMISTSRTFGRDTDQQGVVESALASFVASASQRLRASNRAATRLSIFVCSDRHKPGYRRWGKELILDQPTADTGHLIKLACDLFASIYEPGAQYHRGGVLLSGFVSNSELQTDLLGYRDAKAFDQSKQRMEAIDALQARYGAQAMYYASEKLAPQWRPRVNIRSPRYTTRWEELPTVTPLP
ncbi:MAG: Y-family DNA polymerase [Candidatus Saccharimonadales bacterium]